MAKQSTKRNRATGSTGTVSTRSWMIVMSHTAVAILSFTFGTITTFFVSSNHTCGNGSILNYSTTWQHLDQSRDEIVDENRRLYERIRAIEKSNDDEVERQVLSRLETEVRKQCDNTRVLEPPTEEDATNDKSISWLPAEHVGKYAVAIARVSKQDFADSVDMGGIPLDPPTVGGDEALIIYSRHTALPNSSIEDYNTIPRLEMPDAIKNCDFLNVILTDNTGRRNQCVALVPQYESFHIQKFMRIDTTEKIDSQLPLQLVSRAQTSGRNHFRLPDADYTRQFWAMLSSFLSSVDLVLDELRPILERIEIDNTVIVMVCNFGQSQLLMNFICSAKSRNLDISNVIVFTTDQETTDIVTSLGLTAYYDHRNFGDISLAAARRYGDTRFAAMMMAKIMCVQLVSMLEYDFLFQDVDIVWFKHPMEYFSKMIDDTEYDTIFQDDGGHSVRYAPYSANSGFYFVRASDRTRNFLKSILMSGDFVLRSGSHQQVLIALLNEHASLFALKVKVVPRTNVEFPGGYQFHQKSKLYMRSFFKGVHKPYIFHMSWTMNKDDKILFFRQMGEWYVHHTCIDTTVEDIEGIGSSTTTPDIFTGLCCSNEAIFSCHYRDKPSIKACRKSPPKDKGKRSWW